MVVGLRGREGRCRRSGCEDQNYKVGSWPLLTEEDRLDLVMGQTDSIAMRNGLRQPWAYSSSPPASGSSASNLIRSCDLPVVSTIQIVSRKPRSQELDWYEYGERVSSQDGMALSFELSSLSL